MTTLKFADTHNLVVFFEKSTKTDRFKQIVDFLNAHTIKYVLTVNPTIYISCIEQLWTTAKVKTVNGVVQLQALVDGKKIIITESIVRRDLQLEDAEGVDCLPNATIFKQLTLMGKPKKNTEVPHPSGSTNNVADEAVYKELDDSLVRAATTASILEAEQDSGDGPGVNTPRSDEDSMKLKELMEFCTKLQQRVLDLENTKTAQAQEITSLKLRVKKLEKKGGSRTHKLKRLYKVGRSARVISSDEASLGDQEDASKQGRKIDDIDKDAEITLVDETQGRYGDDLMFDTGVLDDEEVFAGQDMAEKEINVAEKEVSTADPVTTAASTRPKAKGLIIHEEKQANTPTISSQQPSQLKVQDKGKGKMEEPEKPMKKKELIRLDEEIASKLQAEFDEEVRLAREKAKKEEEANIVSWDNVQAMIDVDYQMAQQMQVEEQEKLSIEEKSKLFVQLLEARKKYFAAMRAQEKRNKPLTKA
ncbi:hypothetical protein Tco_1410203 [Tanacetum coccineum]